MGLLQKTLADHCPGRSPILVVFIKGQLKTLFYNIQKNSSRIHMNSTYIQSRGAEALQLQQKSRSVQKLQSYEEKAFKALELNAKLKQLFQTITNNNLARKMEESKANESEADNQHVIILKKKEARLISQMQQLTNNLNILTSDNNKLKAHVNGSRNSRVIYSNVYKTIEKQIRKQEYLYKLAIIESLCYEEVDNKVNERITTITKKLEKDINELEGRIRPMKKDKYKSRINTGLSTFRGSKADSKDTNRSETEAGRITNGGETRRDEVINELELVSKRDPHPSRIRNETAKFEISPILNKDAQLDNSKINKSKSKIPTEHLLDDDYQLLMKNNYYNNVYKQLREICEVDTLREMAAVWKEAEGSVQREYAVYLELEDKLKSLREEQLAIQQSRKTLVSRQEIAEKTSEEQQLQLVDQEFLKEKEKMGRYESRLTELMDLNCHRLSDDDIQQHLTRIKRKGEATNRELERMLENVSKDKN